MLIADYLNPNIPPLKPSDSVELALNWLNEFKISSLPVVEHGKYLGMVSEMMMLDLSELDAQIASIPFQNGHLFLNLADHFSQLLKLASKFDFDTMAVVNEQGLFEGVVCVKDCIQMVSKSFATQSEGGILVLSLYQRDYSLSQIARIVEAENAKILSTFAEVDFNDPLKLTLTLKLDQKDLSHITATLLRFDYQVLARFDDSRFESSYADRLDILFKLFDI